MTEQEIKTEYLKSRREQFIRDICGNEMNIAYLKTKDGKDSVGSNVAEDEIKKAREYIEESKKKLKFIDSLIEKNAI